MSEPKKKTRARKSKKQYFGPEVDVAIIAYNASEDSEVKSRIYNREIRKPMEKLVENIIHTFKFYYTDVERIEDLKHEVVTVLLEEKIMKFDPDNGAKAYSYFGTIVKRWLINYNNKNYKKLKQIGSFNDMDDSYNPGEPTTEHSKLTLASFLDTWVGEMYDAIDDNFPKEVEKKIADAVLTIFKTRNDLEIFKKKALYIYIREMTDCETPHLTRVISKLKELFYNKYQRYYDIGYFDNSFK